MSEAKQQTRPAFDPSKTMLLIAAWPDRLVAPELIIWPPLSNGKVVL